MSTLPPFSHVPANARPINLSRGAPFCLPDKLHSQIHVTQLPNVLRVNGDDIEMKPSGPASDPYTLRVGLKTDEELSQLRRRNKHGKSLESYHRKQNDVRVHPLYLHSTNHLLTSAAHPFTLEINGRPYQGGQGS